MKKLMLLITVTLFLLGCNSEPENTVYGNWQVNNAYTKLKIYKQGNITIIHLGANNTTKTKHELISNSTTDYSVKKGGELLNLKFDKNNDFIIYDGKTWKRINWHNSPNWY
jgi:ABC-type uncharacterized transport system auxiliary subunit